MHTICAQHAESSFKAFSLSPRRLRTDFYNARNEILSKEASEALGADIVLDEDEQEVNLGIMEEKLKELDQVRCYFNEKCEGNETTQLL